MRLAHRAVMMPPSGLTTGSVSAGPLADEQALREAFEALDLPSGGRRYLNDRFLAYAEFCENQARKWRIGYYWLRIPAIVLATIVPALVAANLGTTGRIVATGLGVLVAALSSAEHFLNAGGRWRHYRALVERLKSDAWAYQALAGPYASDPDHAIALPGFVAQVERLIRTDVDDYVALVKTERELAPPPPQPDGEPVATPTPASNLP